MRSTRLNRLERIAEVELHKSMGWGSRSNKGASRMKMASVPPPHPIDGVLVDAKRLSEFEHNATQAKPNGNWSKPTILRFKGMQCSTKKSMTYCMRDAVSQNKI